MIDKQDLQKATELINALETVAKKRGTAPPPIPEAFEIALTFFATPAPAEFLAGKIIDVWEERMAGYLQKVLAEAEQIANVSLGVHLAEYRGEDEKAAELRVKADDLTEAAKRITF